MGKGRGKGTKLNGSINHEDCGSGEDEKIPVQKKRGRPLKHLKKQVYKTDEGDTDNTIFIHKSQCDDGVKKRKTEYMSKEKEEHSESELVKEESRDETKSNSIEEEPIKTRSICQNSRRRKNKPRRAAEAVFEWC